MYIREFRLRNFRNYTTLDTRFQPGFHLFIGSNGQGKSNLLEAIYLLGTRKSFRGVPSAQMIQHGKPGYFVGCTAIAEHTNEIRIYWSPAEQKISLNGRNIVRMNEFFGTVRAVVFCSEDMLLVKGPPEGRRRYVDFLIAQSDPTYLDTLTRYGQTLRARNALLKQSSINRALLESFTYDLVTAGTDITCKRRALIQQIAPMVQTAYNTIAANAPEAISLTYCPNVVGDMSIQLAQAFRNEVIRRFTTVGPHRDELNFQMNGMAASKFASEGQKRTWALALKMAQVRYLEYVHGTLPILLIDDVMGELDARRRQSFLPLLNQVLRTHGQTFMTCTEKNWPRELGLALTEWNVQSGSLFPGKT